MPITRTESGTVFTGENATRAFQCQVFISALKAEAIGLRLTRGPSALARAKQMNGLRTNDRTKHIAWFEARREQLLWQDAIEAMGECPFCAQGDGPHSLAHEGKP